MGLGFFERGAKTVVASVTSESKLRELKNAESQSGKATTRGVLSSVNRVWIRIAISRVTAKRVSF